MNNKILFVYDDTKDVGSQISEITGDKKIGEVIYKRKTIKEHFAEKINCYNFEKELIGLDRIEELPKLIRNMEMMNNNVIIIHTFSSFIIKDEKAARILVEKMKYIKDNFIIRSNGTLAFLAFNSVREYILYLKGSENIGYTYHIPENIEFKEIENDAMVDISNLSSFTQFITSGFDARFFNSLQGNQYVVVKSSTNKKKIKSEYMYYHLLPDCMKMWFVMPFDYEETEEVARYSMERYQMTDLAIRWTHNAIGIEEFKHIINKIFYYVNSRKKKEIDREEYIKVATELYVNKVISRVEELKKIDEYDKLHSYILKGTKYEGIDEIINEYVDLYHSIIKDKKLENSLVIGHGDLCFSNILYNKGTSLIKFIDTKGATKEEELWMNPYYDLAKLSHSICGRYDFFNASLYEISLNEELQFTLEIKFDNSQFIKCFRNELEKSGYDYRCVRLFEASLFLSMLPLHMDYPKKVFGFLLNAINIMKELKEC